MGNGGGALRHCAGTVILLGILAAGGLLARADERQWPRWRGPDGNGHTTESGLPVRWDASSVIWKAALPGRGQSSPVLWGDRIFLTSALENGRQRVVFCLDARNGQQLWQHVAWTGTPEPSHKMNGWASASCVTDGEIVAAFFGKGGLHAYRVDGTHLWSLDLGPFENPWGAAACPVIVGDMVIQNGDSDRNAFIAAFDRRSGKTVWRRPRPDYRGWSTPILLQRGGRQELVLNGHTGVTSYDPASGEEIWFTASSNGRGEPTVTPGGGLLFVVCGLAGDMYAVRPAEPPAEPEVVWKASRRGGRYLPSPIVVGDYVLVSNMIGIMTCYHAQTGRELWRERLEGNFSSSPVVIDGLVFHQNEAGETFVIRPDASYQLVARNRLNGGDDELFRASLTPLGGRIYVRSDRMLYCIGAAASP